jgi:flagellar export protein FliJ
VKPFDTLIRLSEQQLDEKRRQLAVLEDRLDVARAQRKAIDDELAREQGQATQDGTALFAYGAYAAEVIRRRKRADALIVAAERDAELAREDVRTAFAELKRYQITHDKKLADLAKAQANKDQIELDEIAQQLDRRKGDRL